MIMQPFELRALKNLPEKVVCYRIHHSKEEHDWISYTISRQIIPKIVKAYRKHDAFYSVEKFEVAKQDIDFFFGRNYEDEIVVLDRSKVKKIKGGKAMLSIGVGETVTDGFKTYVLTSEFDYKFVSYGNHAQHHVSPEVLKMLVGEED